MPSSCRINRPCSPSKCLVSNGFASPENPSRKRREAAGKRLQFPVMCLRSASVSGPMRKGRSVHGSGRQTYVRSPVDEIQKAMDPTDQPVRLLSSKYPPVPHLPTCSTWDFLFRIRHTINDDQVIYVDQTNGETVNFGELRHITKALAYAFVHKLGLKKGDVILLFSRNTLYYPAIVLATQAAGIICSPANSLFNASELAYQITDSGAKVVIAGQDQLVVAEDACNELGISSLFVLDKYVASTIFRSSIWSCVDGAELESEPLSSQEAKERTTLLCYSSGTSGRPKGVKTSHSNLTSSISQAMAITPAAFTRDEVWIGTLPLGHFFALFLHIFVAPYIGAKVVILPKFDLVQLLSAIERYRGTACHIVPPIAVKLTKDILPEDYDISSLREWRSGAAPLGLELTSLLESKWGVPLHAHYGMTETSGVIALTGRSVEKAPYAAVGLLAPNMEAKIQDGELCLRGPNIMLGYHNRPEANAEAFDEEGYMHTGDVVHIDEDGFIYVVDRTKEIIKYNGYQVAPAELEDILLKHPDVNDVAVVGVDDPKRGTEVPLAFVVLSEPCTNTDILTSKEKELSAYLAGQVSYFKQLRGGILFVDAIPKSPAGKILRRLLREEIRSGRRGSR